jgi:hypothetical protein
LFAGRLYHKDNTGHSSTLEAGGVQWMNAGRGIVHSEMPEQCEGKLSGIQLWVNLPRAVKMCKPKYSEFTSSKMPEEEREGDVIVRVIAGRSSLGTCGPIQGIATNPIFFDTKLPPEGRLLEPIEENMGAFLFIINGNIIVRDDTREIPLRIKSNQLVTLDPGEMLDITAGNDGARMLLIAGKRLDEPITRHGPFVMTTTEEIQQAIDDYNSGGFGHLD